MLTQIGCILPPVLLRVPLSKPYQATVIVLGALLATLALSGSVSVARAASGTFDCAGLQEALDNSENGDVITLSELCTGMSFRLKTDVEITLQGDSSDTDPEGFDGTEANYRALTGLDVKETVIKGLIFRDYSPGPSQTTIDELEEGGCPAPYLPGVTPDTCDLDSTAASGDGGAVLLYGYSWPRFEGNTCVNNHALGTLEIGLESYGNGGCLAVRSTFDDDPPEGAKVSILDNEFGNDEEESGNTAANYGGAVYVSSYVSVDFNDNTVEDSEAAGYGGGAYLDILEALNFAIVQDAAISEYDGPKLVLDGNRVEHNESYASGGGIYARAHAADVTDNVFFDNEIEAYEVEAAEGGYDLDMYGGGLYIAPPRTPFIYFPEIDTGDYGPPQQHARGPLTQEGNLFERNNVEERQFEGGGHGGGGEWVVGFNATSIDDRFTNNSVEGEGGEGGGLGVKAAYPQMVFAPTFTVVEPVEEYNYFRAYNLAVAANEVGEYSAGGGIYVGSVNQICNFCGVHLELYNSTVSGNSAGTEGDGDSYGPGIAGGGRSVHDTLYVANSIVYGNSAPGGEGNDPREDVYYQSFLSTEAEYSDICKIVDEANGPHPGPGNICADPLLADPTNGDVHQTASSPTLEQGSDSLVPSFLTEDYEGDPRKIDYDGDGHTVDMGADERVRPVVVTPTPPTPPVTPAPPSLIDLAVTKVAGPNPVVIGQNVTYTILVSNAGPAAATNVIVTDTLPAGSTLVKVDSPSNVDCSAFGTTGSCKAASLAASASFQILVVLKANVAGSLTNTVTVKGDQAESTLANNSATATVRAVPLGTCLVQASTGSLFVGLRQTVTVRVIRNGKAAAGVTVTARGGGVNLRAETSAAGVARLVIKPTKAGRVVVASVAGCDQSLMVVKVARDCSGVSISPKSLIADQPNRFSARVRLLGQALAERKVVVRGSGIWRVGWTDATGRLTLKITPPKAGLARVTVHLPGGVTCVKRIGLVQPSDGDELTG